MKKISLVLLALAMALGMNLSAQDKYGPNKDECIKYLSYYQEYYKQKNYDEALPNWRTAMKLCPPTASQNMLLNGMTLLSREINKTKDAAARTALVDSLLMLNDLRAEYYPNYAVAAMNTKGQYMTQFYKDPKLLYEGLSAIVEAYEKYYEDNRSEFFNPDVTLAAMDLSGTDALIESTNALFTAMNTGIEEGRYAELNQARAKTKAF